VPLVALLLTAGGCVRQPPAALDVVSHVAAQSGVLDNAHLITGPEGAILVDAHAILPDARDLVERVRDSGKPLQAIFITHAHPDHYAALEVLRDAFPEVPILATPEVAGAIAETGEAALAAVRARYGDLAAQELVVPQAFEGRDLELDGQEIRLVRFAGGEASHQVGLYVPSSRAFIAADLVNDEVHPMLAEKGVERYLGQLEGLAALRDIDVVHVGHGARARDLAAFDEMKIYLVAFDGAVRDSVDADQAWQRMSDLYPRWRSADYLLWRSVCAYLPPQGDPARCARPRVPPAA
jgi:glyoxylase-like metal-dependent hydrolase (beta-lactamase superfamily II)